MSALLINARVVDLHLGLASTLPTLQPLKHPSPLCIEASDLGTTKLAPHIISASANGKLPFVTDPIAIPHPFLSDMSEGGLLQ